jgi:N-acetylglutamate synthase-like GNAT family acetyltransferase
VIRRCTSSDIPTIDAIVNEAAEAYKGVIPPDCWHEPYMSRAQLEKEIAAGVVFSAWEHEGQVVGVMGLQPVRDVVLIRHAYVRPSAQGRGVGAALLTRLADEATTRLLVGTWADARWAIRFYEHHGFRLVDSADCDRLLQTYWDIPRRQREVSVVLERPR